MPSILRKHHADRAVRRPAARCERNAVHLRVAHVRRLCCCCEIISEKGKTDTSGMPVEPTRGQTSHQDCRQELPRTSRKANPITMGRTRTQHTVVDAVVRGELRSDLNRRGDHLVCLVAIPLPRKHTSHAKTDIRHSTMEGKTPEIHQRSTRTTYCSRRGSPRRTPLRPQQTWRPSCLIFLVTMPSKILTSCSCGGACVLCAFSEGSSRGRVCLHPLSFVSPYILWARLSKSYRAYVTHSV